MRRTLFLLATLASTMTLAAGGCRSCSSCYDYSPPVANCDCNACGTQHAGSAGGAVMSNSGYAEEPDVANPQ